MTHSLAVLHWSPEVEHVFAYAASVTTAITSDFRIDLEALGGFETNAERRKRTAWTFARTDRETEPSARSDERTAREILSSSWN